MASTDARPVPIKAAAFRLYWMIDDSAGARVTGGLSSLAGQVDKDAAGFGAITNTPTEIGTSGVVYLDLTAVEMNADAVNILITSTEGRDQFVTLYPQESDDIQTTATLAASQPNYAPAVAGDEMDLVDAPNATAVTAIQNGLSTFDPTSDAVANVTLVDTTTTNTDMRGTDSAYTGTPPTVEENRAEMDSNSTQLAKLGTPSGASVSADIAAIEAQTNNIGVAGAGLTALPWNAAWDAEVESEALDALNTILADSIPADGTLPTLRQAIYMLTQFMLEREVSGTTVTVKKADGSTSLFTLSLDDGTSPTTITRSA